MGTFAGIFEMKQDGVSDSKAKEFAEKVQKVFRSGGMMDVKIVQLCGKRKDINLLKLSIRLCY